MSVARLELEVAAQRAFDRMCEVARVPEWVSGVAEVTVLETDERGRPTRAQFLAMPARGSVAYELLYAYDDQELSVTWTTPEGAVRVLRGEARFAVLERDRCMVIYRVQNGVGPGLPVWARELLREESPEALVYAFRRWLERP